MSVLYLVDETDLLVWVYRPTGEGSWLFSRQAPSQRSKNHFVLSFMTKGQPGGWVVQDCTPGARGEIIATPVEKDKKPGALADPDKPPLGQWLLWGARHRLTDVAPSPPPQSVPSTVEVEFASFIYSETANIARLELVFKNVAVTEASLEAALSSFKGVLRNLASRPNMVLLMRTDGRKAALPSVKLIRRFLAFMQEMGPEFVLVGRGSAIVLEPPGILGSALLSIVRMVQKMLPAPWPETIVTSMEDADKFLDPLADEAAAQALEDMRASCLADPSVPLTSDIEDKETRLSVGTVATRAADAGAEAAAAAAATLTSPPAAGGCLAGGEAAAIAAAADVEQSTPPDASVPPPKATVEQNSGRSSGGQSTRATLSSALEEEDATEAETAPASLQHGPDIIETPVARTSWSLWGCGCACTGAALPSSPEPRSRSLR